MGFIPVPAQKAPASYPGASRIGPVRAQAVMCAYLPTRTDQQIATQPKRNYERRHQELLDTTIRHRNISKTTLT